jgi:hypothetical protein
MYFSTWLQDREFPTDVPKTTSFGYLPLLPKLPNATSILQDGKQLF